MMFVKMSKKTHFWSAVWQVVEFILSLGLSHIAKRKNNTNSNDNS